MIKTILIVLAVLTVIVIVIINSAPYKRLLTVLSLFKPENIAYNFCNMEKLFPSNEIQPASNPSPLKEDLSFKLPDEFIYKDKSFHVGKFLEKSQSSGLIIVKNDSIRFEEYFHPLTKNGKHISWSVCKSMISAMVGVAFREGFLNDIHDPIEKYVPSLRKSGYAGTSIKNVLQMSSGIAFNEDYHNFKSDINRLGRVFALGSSFDKFVKTLKKVREPGTYHDYISMDTQVLGMLIRESSGMTLSAFLEHYIWKPMGAESSARWLKDRKGMEAAFGGLNCSLRDYARFGLMYANNGLVNNNQVIPKQWVHDSVHSVEKHLQAGDLPDLSSHIYGYGYQWWLPQSDSGEYLAMGVYNQFIYVDPKSKIIIVKNSSNYNYATEKRETTYRHLAFFRAIKNKLITDEI